MVLTFDDFRIDYIGLGQEKCGTSTIAHWLKAHPEIILHPSKELNYFSKNNQPIFDTTDEYLEKGIQGYIDRFNDVYLDFNKKIGEFSTQYLDDTGHYALHRINKYFPNTKLIICLREPVSRLFSAYKFHVFKKQWLSPMSFEEYIMEVKKELNRGFYSDGVGKVLELFPPENVKVLFLEDMKENPDLVAKELFSFLGVDDTFCVPSAKTAYNPSMEKRKIDKVFDYAPKAFYVMRHRFKMGRLLDFMRDKGGGELFFRVRHWIGHKKRSFSMNPLTRELLKNYYSADVKRLSSFLGRDLCELWGYQNYVNLPVKNDLDIELKKIIHDQSENY